VFGIVTLKEHLDIQKIKSYLLTVGNSEEDIAKIKVMEKIKLVNSILFRNLARHMKEAISSVSLEKQCQLSCCLS
jgi:hypothetical protein